MQSILMICICVFIWWLVIHFVLHTFVTYQLWFDWWWIRFIWLWKELLISFMIWIVLYYYRIIIWSWRLVWYHIMTYLSTWRRIPHISLTKLWYQQRVQRWTIWIIMIIIWYIIFSSILALGVVWSTRYALWASYKYNLIGFIVLILGIMIGTIIDKHHVDRLTASMILLLKIVVIWWILWYMVLLVRPHTLELLWYDSNVCEWSLVQAPPAVYRTELCFWSARNQFVFERPTSLWFWLIAWWPLFFVLWMWYRKSYDTMHRWLLRMIILMSTFSRAARWAQIIQIIVMSILIRRVQYKKVLLYVLCPLCIIIGGWLYMYDDHIISRYYSDVWHINETFKAINKVWQYPREWRGPGIAWPASHQLYSMDIAPYNPENQFLQILIEHGIIWWIWWIVAVISLSLIWLLPYIYYVYTLWFISSRKIKRSLPEYSIHLLWYSLGVMWLLICWFVLHPWWDKMIIYPLMMMMGIILWSHSVLRKIHDLPVNK